MVRRKGLYENPPRRVSPSAPARGLGKKLKGTFRGPEIGEPQGLIRHHHPHEHDPRIVMSFDDHLGSDQDIDLPPL